MTGLRPAGALFAGKMHGWLSKAARALVAPLAVGALYVVAALPLLHSSLTVSDDGLVHLYRLLEFDRCLSQGSLLPRWMPDLAQGYGFPLLNFHPPLAYYVAEVWHLLGFNLVQALNLTLILSGMLAGISMYLLVCDWAGQKGAVLAGLLYMYAPFALYSTYFRGGVAEVLVWGLAPFALWAFRRLVLTGDVRWVPLAAIAFAAIPLTHFLAALMLTPLLLVAVVSAWMDQPSWRGLALAAMAGGLALGCSAFSALPALLEKGSVHMEWATSGYLDFRQHFPSWRWLLSGPVPVDISLASRSIPLSIGWIQLGMALLGLVALIRSGGCRRVWGIGVALISALLVLLTQKVTLPVWEAVSVVQFLQVPWRLLYPVGLLLAVLAGGVGSLFSERGKWRCASAALVGLVALALFYYNTPLFEVRRYRLPSQPGLADLQQYERSVGAWGLTTRGEYLPKQVQEMPPEPRPLANSAEAPGAWVDIRSLPRGSTISNFSYRLNHIEFDVSGDVAFRATVNQFYFPGWRAYVDYKPVHVGTLPVYGLMAIDLAPGGHHVELRFEDTPLRKACTVASVASLLTLVGVGAFAWRRRRPAAAIAARAGEGRASLAIGGDYAPARGVMAGSGWLLLLTVAAGFVVLKATFLDRHDHWLRYQRLDGDRLKGVEHPIGADFGDELMLLGYDLPPRAVAAGEAAKLTLYWKALRPMLVEYSSSLQLVDNQGHLWGQQDRWNVADFPTTRWTTDSYRPDDCRVPVLPGTPPGEYLLRAHVYEQNSGHVLPVVSGAQPGPWAIVGKVQVTRPAEPPALEALGMLKPLTAKVNGDLELLGCNLPQGPVRPGQRVGLTLFWRALRQPGADYQALLLLKDVEGKVLRQEAWPVASASYPTSACEAGEVIRGQYDLLIPAEAPAGANMLQVTLSGGAEAVTLGELEVVAVPHRMDVPEMQARVGATFGDAITLLGYDLDRREAKRGETIHLTLYWQAQRSIEQEYSVFTHLLDGTNHISAQQDSVPVRGARPTTGWVEGEVIMDEYELVVKGDAPTGEHQIEVGLYEPESGRRLSVTGGGHAVDLCSVIIR